MPAATTFNAINRSRPPHMNFVLWILLGGLLGRYASALMGIRERQAILRNVVVGIGGVMLSGWLLATLIGSPAFARGEFNISSMLVSLMGATILLAAVQLLRSRFLTAKTPNPDEISAMNSTPREFPGLRPLVAASLTGMFMFFAACASTPEAPDSALDAARVAISNAEKAEAGQFASAELGEARDKLASANSAVQEENMITAERFAQESRVQAELASARTAAAKAAAVNREMERGADALTEEMQRAGEAK
jgi:uncharacterized membrane protein YeaQ/YmgE (transglycosylase-associated protein family)